jgi:hypothetical protein
VIKNPQVRGFRGEKKVKVKIVNNMENPKTPLANKKKQAENLFGFAEHESAYGMIRRHFLAF